MFELHPSVRAYAWGSRTALPELCGYPCPAPHPVAEYWFGAHSSSPATCPDGEALDARITAAPLDELGAHVHETFGGQLPYLVKLLAADEALSLQAHPSAEQAREGFAREEAQGIPLDSPIRNYKDTAHKPELVVALTEFHALAGFRTVADTIDLFDCLAVEGLGPYRRLLAAEPDAAGVRAVFTTFATLPHRAIVELVVEVVAASIRLLSDHGQSHRWSAVATTVLELGERHPADPGVLGALLLNRITLVPGEGIYLGAGNLHAYLEGIAIEVQANSDNVLRGGLTPKHVDVPELLRVLDFRPIDDPVVRPVLIESGDGWAEYCYGTDAAEFAVTCIDIEPGGEVSGLDDDGPQIFLTARGDVTVASPGASTEPDDAGPADPPQPLPVGRALWVPASEDGPVLRASSPAAVFRTRVDRAAGAPRPGD